MVVKKTAAEAAPAKQPSAPGTATPGKATTTTAAAGEAAAKKASATKSAARKSATRSAAKKAAVKAPAKKAPARKAPAKRAAAKSVTANETGASKVAAKKTAAGTAATTGAASAVPAARAAAEPGVLAVLPGEDPWTPEEAEEARTELLSEVERYQAEIVSSEAAVAGLLRDSGDGAGDDEADTGTKNITREYEMALAANTREMLEQSQHALERLEEGTYGQCESCGNPIGKARMQAFPRATLCLDCKQRQERR